MVITSAFAHIVIDGVAAIHIHTRHEDSHLFLNTLEALLLPPHKMPSTSAKDHYY